jgi:hypothetical protein
MKKTSFLLVLVVLCCGCAALKDAPLCIAGVSTRSLESGKKDSIYQVYPCGLTECFQSVVDISAKNGFLVFRKDPVRGLVVVMDIPGQVNTTEVGIFLTELSNDQGVRIDLSSRSTPAKRAVAKALFSELNDLYKK